MTSSNARLRELPSFEVSRGNALRNDPRWKLAESVVAGPHFMRSALLSKFLLYVVAETLDGRQQTITEHRIGVVVFGRPPHYRTDEDNIVRNYARQLRRRLADHFGSEGRSAPMRIEIPVGGYVPSFPAVPVELPAQKEHTPGNGFRLAPEAPARLPQPASRARQMMFGTQRMSARRLMVVTLVIAVLGTGWAVLYRFLVLPRAHDPMTVLWRNVMPMGRTTYLVPADAGLNLIEDLSHHSVPLSEYVNGSYETAPTGAVDRHTGQDLHTQQYTDFVSLDTISRLARRSEFDPQRVQSRFPRDLLLSDLKSANAIIIGSSSSNPWAAIADADTNFGIVTRPDMQGAQIVNRRPQPGELPVYTSNWNEPAHETFALILYQPNLSRTGNILLIEGLDVAGTQGAAEILFQSDSISSILQRAARANGTLRNFEILLRTTSIQSSAKGTQILASRIE